MTIGYRVNSHTHSSVQQRSSQGKFTETPQSPKQSPSSNWTELSFCTDSSETKRSRASTRLSHKKWQILFSYVWYQYICVVQHKVGISLAGILMSKQECNGRGQNKSKCVVS